MVKVEEWTHEEVDRLRRLYSSNRTFDEIIGEFPERTSNAIRLKASRLGIKRPTLPGEIIHIKPLLYKSVNGKGGSGFLLKCKQCNSWIQVDEDDNKRSNIISCGECGYIYQVITEM